MKRWKLWKLSLAAAALIVGTGTVARATPFVLDGTYVFSSNDPRHSLDGSYVTFLNDVIVDWYLLDTHANDANGYPPNNLPLTPANSHHDPIDAGLGYSGVFGPDQWQFKIIGTVDPLINYYDFFKGWNNLNGTSALYDGFGDPEGTWTFRPSVPDASGTFQLLVGALTALGASRYLLFRRAAQQR